MALEHTQTTIEAGNSTIIGNAAKHPGTWAYVNAYNINGGSLAVTTEVGVGNDVPYADSPITSDGGIRIFLTGGPVKLALTGGGPVTVVIGGEGQKEIR